MGGSRGGTWVWTPPHTHTHTWKITKNLGFLSKKCNTSPDPLKNHKATKPAFNVGPSSPRQRNDGDPLIMVFRSSLASSIKKRSNLFGPPSDKIFWVRALTIPVLTIKSHSSVSSSSVFSKLVWNVSWTWLQQYKPSYKSEISIYIFIHNWKTILTSISKDIRILIPLKWHSLFQIEKFSCLLQWSQ